jgi:hypothetical protein
MRPLILLVALYGAFMVGRWYAPHYDTLTPVSAGWTGEDMESEVPYAAGYEAGVLAGKSDGYDSGYRDGQAACVLIPSINQSESVEVGYVH